MSDNLNILVLNYEYPPIGGGGGIISKYISEGLAKIGHKITIITAWLEGLEKDSKKDNLHIIRLKSKRKNSYRSNPSEMLSWIKHSKLFLSEYCKNEHFDICISNFIIPGGNVAKYLLEKLNIPYIVISHGHDIPWVKPYPLYFLHLLNYFKIKSICKKASSICVQSSEMLLNLEKFIGTSSKNILIKNGYDTTLFFPDYSKRSEKLKILFSGRLVKQKDPFTFLKAIKEFSISNQNFTANIIGDGPLRRSMEKYISKNDLSELIYIRGKISYSEVINELQSSHIYVSSSLSEGMSISLIEAVACGLYSIVTPTSGTKEIIIEDGNGEFVNFRSHNQIADSINNFYSNKFSQDHQNSSEFFNTFSKNFGWDFIVGDYNRLIKKVLS